MSDPPGESLHVLQMCLGVGHHNAWGLALDSVIQKSGMKGHMVPGLHAQVMGARVKLVGCQRVGGLGVPIVAQMQPNLPLAAGHHLDSDKHALAG